MGRVIRLRNVALVSILAVAALLLVLSRGDTASATPCNPPQCTPGQGAWAPFSDALVAGAKTDVQLASSSVTHGPVGEPTEIPAALVILTPGDWTIGGGGAIGDATGTAATTVKLGVANGPCALPVGLPGLTLINASTDTTPANVMTGSGNFTNMIGDTDDGTGPWISPSGNGIPNGIPDGADRMNNLILATIPFTPVQRSYTQIPNLLGTGTNITADVITYAPGVVPGTPPTHYSTFILIENFAAALPPTPFGSITDSCGFSSTLVIPPTSGPGPVLPAAVFGVPPDPAYPIITAGGGLLRANPPEGQKLFITSVRSVPDADNDGIDNGDDTCATTPNVGNPYGLPPSSGGAGEVPSSDGIDAACDNTSVFTDGNPTPWDALSTCRAGVGDNGAAIDCDLDGFLNRGDNCPQNSNPTQADPDNDNIGTACDPNPATPDGHTHSTTLVHPICITGPNTVDANGDGICEFPTHDLAIKKVNGDTLVNGGSECTSPSISGCGYNIILKNNHTADETGSVGVVATPLSGCAAPMNRARLARARS